MSNVIDFPKPGDRIPYLKAKQIEAMRQKRAEERKRFNPMLRTFKGAEEVMLGLQTLARAAADDTSMPVAKRRLLIGKCKIYVTMVGDLLRHLEKDTEFMEWLKEVGRTVDGRVHHQDQP